MNDFTLSKPETIRVRFVRKPCNLYEVLLEVAADRIGSSVVVAQTKMMTEAEYDEFAENLLTDRDWLPGQSGSGNMALRCVIEVSAPNRQTLYVDPSGYRYARHVGLRMD